MLSAIGTTPAGFIVVTLLLMGVCALLTGQAVAKTWRPAWQVAAYALLLAAADRFLVFALFDGELLSIAGYVVDACLLGAVAAGAYKATRARKMVAQYPWRYRRAGLFGWREIGGGHP